MRTQSLERVLTLVLCLGSGAALATQSTHEVVVQLGQEPLLLKAGVRVDLKVELTAARGGNLTGLNVVPDGWALHALSTTALTLKALDPKVVSVTVTPSDPAKPLVFVFQLDGVATSAALDLSPAHLEPLVRVQTLAALPAGAQVPSLPLTLLAPAPAGPPQPIAALLPPPPGTVRKKVTVHGQLSYQRGDGTFLGADGATIRVFDRFGPLDVQQDSATTDAFGRFSLSFDWLFCGVCRNPNLVVKAESGNGRADVKVAALARSYTWESGTRGASENATDVDFGSLGASENAQALHILTDLTRAWRYLKVSQGYDLPSVDVRWPDDNRGSSYSSEFRQIYISTSREWGEDTHCHEYMHHWAAVNSSNEAPDYCNNTCDGPPRGLDPNCGHCGWCAETDHDAFGEGIANWFADYMTRVELPGYGVAPVNTRPSEQLQTCNGGAFGNPNTTENFFAALLGDIEDPAQDAEPSMPGQIDALSLGPDLIFEVADLYDTRSPLDFIARFRQHVPSLSTPLWKTSANNGYFVGLDPCQQTVPADQWRGAYFLGKGAPAGVLPIAVRADPSIQFDWGTGSPHPECGLPADDFTVVWTKQVFTEAGPYRAMVTADDGVRVFVDGALVIDQWRDQPATTYRVDLTLTRGNHALRVEYYERGVGAVARFSLQPICNFPLSAGGWKGEYFAGRTFTGTPLLVRDDTNAALKLDLDFGSGSPSPSCGVPADDFAARYTRSEYFDRGVYRFTVTADDGVRLYLDDGLVIDRWVDQAATTYTADVSLGAGYHSERVEYYERGGGAVVRASWAPVCSVTVLNTRWRGEYFANTTLTGPAKLVRDEGDGDLALYWGNASPSYVCGVPYDTFSSRFTRRMFFDGGSYRLTAETYGGQRVRIDGATVMSDWVTHPSISTRALVVAPTAGWHEVMLETYDTTGAALASLRVLHL